MDTILRMDEAIAGDTLLTQDGVYMYLTIIPNHEMEDELHSYSPPFTPHPCPMLFHNTATDIIINI